MNTENQTLTTVEISTKGKRFATDAIRISGATVVVSGRYLRLASIHEEEWLEHEIQDPRLFISTLKDRKPGTFRSDIFTFAQKLPHTEPKYAYLFELDNVAALSVSTF